MIDPTSIGALTAEAMERLSEHFGDEDLDACVQRAALVVEIDTPDDLFHVVFHGSDPPYIAIALLNEGVYSLEDKIQAAREAADE